MYAKKINEYKEKDFILFKNNKSISLKQIFNKKTFNLHLLLSKNFLI